MENNGKVTALAKRSETGMGFEPATLPEAERLAETLSKSMLMPDALKNKPADVLVTILTGRELGLSPMQAIRSIYVVKGRPVASADLMVALCKRSPECVSFRLVESSDTIATYEAQRRGDSEVTRLSWTIEQARQAGLAGNGTWKAHPAAMLRARCAAALARAVFPDLVLGVYEEDEGREIAKPAANFSAPTQPARKAVVAVQPKAPAKAQPEQPATKPDQPIADAEYVPQETAALTEVDTGEGAPPTDAELAEQELIRGFEDAESPEQWKAAMAAASKANREGRIDASAYQRIRDRAAEISALRHAQE